MRLFNAFLLLALTTPLAAQEEEIRRANLPPQLEWELLRMYDGAADRHDGPTTIEAQRVVRGGVAAMGGPLRVAGRIEGDVAMVDGDVVVEPEGVITGSITVIGGEVRMGEDARVGGTITAYGSSSRYAARGRDRDRDRDRDRPERDPDWEWGDDEDDDWWDRRRRDRWDRGHSRLTLRAGSSYNRVEGLPVMFGPVIQTAGANPLRLEALGIWRTESGSLDTDRMGYQVKAEQFLGGDRRWGIGASVFSVVDPLDRWQISDLEASLAAVLFHNDYRDYYDRTGWSAFVRAEPVRGLEARLEYRREEHGSVPAGDPWSLFHRDDEWRSQPLMAEGDLSLVNASLELDLRDDEDDPIRGWYGRVALERPVGGSLTRPALVDVMPPYEPPVGFPDDVVPAADVDTDFTSAFVDLRRYSMVGYESQLSVRVVAGGSLTERPLPAQFQHVLGGIGTLPGFAPFFEGDCGARTAVGRRDGAEFFPSYGCDRFALAQVEYRGDLSLDFGFGDPDYHDDDWWDDVRVDLSPTWVVFFDAGQGWAFEDPVLGPDRDTGVLFDAGFGFLLDKLGIYAALPLNGDVDQEPRFFLRWGRRF